MVGQSSNVDSASQNLASSFVNGLINAGFVHDKLLTTDEGNKWIYKNKTYGDFNSCVNINYHHLCVHQVCLVLQLLLV